MPRTIFINLPVSDLQVSMSFYASLGFTNNPQFTDDTAACMVWSEVIHVMLLTHAKWQTFTSRPIPPKTSSEVMLAINCDCLPDVAIGICQISIVHEAQILNRVDVRRSAVFSRCLVHDVDVLTRMWMDMAAMSAESIGEKHQASHSTASCEVKINSLSHPTNTI